MKDILHASATVEKFVSAAVDHLIECAILHYPGVSPYTVLIALEREVVRRKWEF